MKVPKPGHWITVVIVTLAWVLLLESARSPAQTVSFCDRPLKERALRARNTFKQPVPQNGILSLAYQFRDSMDRDTSVECSFSDSAQEQLKDDFGLFLCTKNDDPKRLACIDDNRQIHPLVGISKKVCEEYLRKRGFKPDGAADDKHCLVDGPDYANLATRAAGVLDACAQKMNERIKTLDDWLAFFQALRPDDNEESLQVQETDHDKRGDKWNGGLLVPTDVMLQNRGDCDSKALAFAALRQERAHLVIFRAPELFCPTTPEEPQGHAFIGVERAFLKEQRRFKLDDVFTEAVRVDGNAFDHDILKIPVLKLGVLLEYTVMETVGPGRTMLGEFDEKKYGMYYGIPLEASQLSSARGL